MNDREMRELLQEIIEEVDQGRLEVALPRTLKMAGTVLAAALGLGLGLAACSPSAKKNTQNPDNGRPPAAQVDASAKKSPPPDPPMAKRPMARKPMVDPGPQPEYAAPATPPTMRPKPRKRRAKPDIRPQTLYGVE